VELNQLKTPANASFSAAEPQTRVFVKQRGKAAKEKTGSIRSLAVVMGIL
jgi:hypothetical protein